MGDDLELEYSRLAPRRRRDWRRVRTVGAALAGVIVVALLAWQVGGPVLQQQAAALAAATRASARSIQATLPQLSRGLPLGTQLTVQATPTTGDITWPQI